MGASALTQQSQWSCMSTVCTWVRACAASTTFSSLDWRRRRVPMGCLKTIKETVWLKSSGRHLNHALYVNTSLTLCRFNGELTTIEWFPCLTGCIWWRRWRLNMHDRTTMHLDKRKKESLCLPHGISSCCDVTTNASQSWPSHDPTASVMHI